MKGLNNLVPETAAFLYRMSGYSIAGMVSLFDTDTSDKLFAQYETVTGRVSDYDNGVQHFGGAAAQIASPFLFKGAAGLGARLYDVESSIAARSTAPMQARNVETLDASAATLERIESRFGGASREVGFIVDAETGNILNIGRQPYSQAYDGFKFTPEQWATAEGHWVTHNHPSGNTLGIQDLASAVSNNARGIRASTSNGTFELSIDRSFAAAYRGDPGAAFGFLQNETNMIGHGIMNDIRSGALVVPEGLTKLQRNGFMANEMWIRYAEKTPGLQYTFTPRKFP